MSLDFKILSLWFVIRYWWYNTLTRENNRFLKVLVRSNFATPTPFGSVSCFEVGICLSNYNLNLFLIHQASYSKEYQWYLMHRKVLGSIWKIGRYPIKVSEVLILGLCVCAYTILVIMNSQDLPYVVSWGQQDTPRSAKQFVKMFHLFEPRKSRYYYIYWVIYAQKTEIDNQLYKTKRK